MTQEAATSLDLDLELDLGLVPQRLGPGRQPKAITAEFSRELTHADLSMPAVSIQKPPSLVKLRDSHHALARTLASGVSEYEASLITGYSGSRISILKADPQFQELLEFYRETATDVLADFRRRMADMGLDALAVLQERLDEKPDEFSPGLLKDIVKDMADRTGHAPAKTAAGGNVNINVNLSDRMTEARARVAAARGKTIDHE